VNSSTEVRLRAETGVETAEINEITLACYPAELKKQGNTVDFEEEFCCMAMVNSQMEQ
jgi:hypothetical protein